MSKGVGSGDRLARGAVRATYTTTEGGITDDKWAKAFGDFDPEKFQNEPNKSQVRSSDTDSEASGVASADTGTVESDDLPF
jgi:hypothetical protein